MSYKSLKIVLYESWKEIIRELGCRPQTPRKRRTARGGKRRRTRRKKGRRGEREMASGMQNWRSRRTEVDGRGETAAGKPPHAADAPKERTQWRAENGERDAELAKSENGSGRKRGNCDGEAAVRRGRAERKGSAASGKGRVGKRNSIARKTEWTRRRTETRGRGGRGVIPAQAAALRVRRQECETHACGGLRARDRTLFGTIIKNRIQRFQRRGSGECGLIR